MNKILSSVLISAIASTVTLSAATAVVGEDVPSADRLSKLYINPTATAANLNGSALLDGANLSSYEHNVSVDFATGMAKPVELVWNSFVNLTSGSKFTLRAVNADFALSQEAVLCTWDGTAQQKIGAMVSVGNTDGSTKMNNMSFRIDDDAAGTLTDAFKRDNNVTFIAGNTCASTTPLSLISTAAACTDISVEIPQAIDDSSQAFTDYTAPAIKVAKTKRLVSVACSVPVCTIDASQESKVFTTTPTATGINNAITPVAGSLRADTYCPECDQSTQASCTTVITVKNTSTDFNITELSVTPVFTNGGNPNMAFTVDANYDGSAVATVGAGVETNTSAALNTLATLKDLNITDGSDHNITITYTPAANSVIEEGSVTGELIFKSNSGQVLMTDREARNLDLAVFSTAGKTEFTVPYMNTSYKSMVKVTSLSNEVATISAVITDQDGVSTPSIDLGTIAPHATAFYFSTQGALKTGADATAGLKNAWSVVFTINAEATVVATMTGPDGGDRAISVF
jgi:hypothetical protein